MTTERTATRPAEIVGQVRFVTGEAVQLDVRVAHIGSRALARLIDIVVQVALMYAILILASILIGFAAVGGVVALDPALLILLQVVTVVAVLIGYPVLLETLTRGRTMGKMVVGLRVVRDDGGPITFRHALTRGLVGFAIEWPGIVGAPLTWLVTIAAMMANPQSKRIGDHVAGTVVIHERTPAAWGWVPQMPPGLAAWAATLDLTGLDDELALALRHYLARNRALREPARTWLGRRLAQEVAAVTNPPPPAEAAGWAYLAAVHAERHRRAIAQLVASRARSATVWPELATTPSTAAKGATAPVRAAQ